MSRILEAMHETAVGLHKAGVMDKVTLRDIEALCVRPLLPMSPEEIKELRGKYGVSQSVFARYLNVQAVTVKKWEQGANSPSGPALKLLHLIKEKGLEPLQF